MTKGRRPAPCMSKDVPTTPVVLPLSTESTNFTHTTVKAGHGYAFEVKKGQRFRITDTHGGQIVDLTAWILLPSTTSSRGKSQIDKTHLFSSDHTRWALTGATPAIGEHLYTNKGLLMLKITADTVRVHDMTFACCYPELYEREALVGHRSCSGNIAEAMKPWGIESHLEIRGPFNCFQNTPNYALKGGLLSSKAGDYVEFEAVCEEGDGVVVAVSSCPFDLEGFAGPTSVEVRVRG